MDDLLRSKLQHQSYDSPIPSSNTHIDTIKDHGDAAGAEETAEQEADYVEFNLFRPSSTKQHLIRLRSASPLDGHEAGFLNPQRPRAYYYSSRPSPSRRKELESVAVSGDDVEARAYGRTLWPGCALPWRVSVIKIRGRTRSAGEAEIHGATIREQAEAGKRKRAGKKRRIAVRKKLAVGREKQRREAELERQKMESEREKRTRKNRQKKVAKKEKEKAKKIAGGGSGIVSGVPAVIRVEDSNGKGDKGGGSQGRIKGENVEISDGDSLGLVS